MTPPGRDGDSARVNSGELDGEGEQLGHHGCECLKLGATPSTGFFTAVAVERAHSSAGGWSHVPCAFPARPPDAKFIPAIGHAPWPLASAHQGDYDQVTAFNDGPGMARACSGRAGVPSAASGRSRWRPREGVAAIRDHGAIHANAGPSRMQAGAAGGRTARAGRGPASLRLDRGHPQAPRWRSRSPSWCDTWRPPTRPDRRLGIDARRTQGGHRGWLRRARSRATAFGRQPRRGSGVAAIISHRTCHRWAPGWPNLGGVRQMAAAVSIPGIAFRWGWIAHDLLSLLALNPWAFRRALIVGAPIYDGSGRSSPRRAGGGQAVGRTPSSAQVG